MLIEAIDLLRVRSPRATGLMVVLARCRAPGQFYYENGTSASIHQERWRMAGNAGFGGAIA
jgi:hypothetical protein